LKIRDDYFLSRAESLGNSNIPINIDYEICKMPETNEIGYEIEASNFESSLEKYKTPQKTEQISWNGI